MEFWKLSAKAFGLKIFSRDDSQGIRTDGKHGGFVDRTGRMRNSIQIFQIFIISHYLQTYFTITHYLQKIH